MNLIIVCDNALTFSKTDIQTLITQLTDADKVCAFHLFFL